MTPGALHRSAVRRSALLAAALAAVVVVSVASLALGSHGLAPAEVWDALVRGGTSEGAVIVRDLRVPRTVLGLVVGAALGLAGALMQALTRNPLADPGLLGVEAGAAAAVVTAIALLGLRTPGEFVAFALVGAAVVAALVHAVGAGRNGTDPVRLVLAGAAVSAVLYAYIEAVILLDPAAFTAFRSWRYGAIAGRDAGDLLVVGPLLFLGAVVALGLGQALNAAALGDDVGAGLGVSLRRTRVLAAAAVAVLCGAATALAGPIAFIGLAVPYVARLLVGADLRWVLVLSLPLGAVALLAADVMGRVVGSPGEVSVGIVTAAVGGPLFVLLVRRRRIPRL